MKDIFKIFGKIGCLGFGGPVATMAMMEREVVATRQWISRERFNQALTLCKLLPGPAASQMAIFLGQSRAGLWGGLLSGAVYIIPGCLLSYGLSFVYFEYGQKLSFEYIFYGIKPVVIAIIADSILRMGRPYFLNPKSIVLILGSFIWMMALPHFEFILIFLCGILSVIYEFLHPYFHRSQKISVFFDLSPLLILALLSLKAGTLFFGGGFAIVALMQHPLVNTYHWMTQKEFLDGIAFGLMTPGPMSSSFVFFGYKVAGHLGALIAPLAFFTPSFIFIYLAMPWMNRLEKVTWLPSFVDGAIVAIIGGIAAVMLPLAEHSVIDKFTLVSLIVSFMLISVKRTSSWILILGSGIAGQIFKTFF